MAFDLDNEELKATRKLHNQDDGLYEETSDKNVENIETTNNKNKYTYIKEVAEKIVNEYREKYKGEKFCPEPSEQTCMAYEILHLLAEREQDKKRIQELEADLYSANCTISDYVDSIPKQKVKDKIGVLEVEEKYDYLDNKKAIQTLEELLEDK